MNQACFHCGDGIIGKPVTFDGKEFCCNGCSSVYNLLSENNLGDFYTLESQAGIRPREANPHKYAFLDIEKIGEKYILFEDENSVHVTLFLPQIHCSSCIYLLENLDQIHPGIFSSQVQFTKRKASIAFDKGQLKFSELALLLDKIGYAPKFGDEGEIRKKINTTFLYKIGMAGFAFGSIMLWTVPEYLGIEHDTPEYRFLPSILSFIVSVPVLLFSANEYLISAWKALRSKSLNLDVPISIGIIALYAQSCIHIFTNDGPGYMDSFAGFIFFLLIGKWFQNKSYESLSFDRDYTSYFPVAVTRILDGRHEIIEIHELKKGDHILLRNEEIIPCDCRLISEETKIDYSFVTGESRPVTKKASDFIYAGGKVLGKKIIIKAEKETSRSHITQLWNESTGGKRAEKESTDKLSIYFITALIAVAFSSALFWLWLDPQRMPEIVVSVLIVACPCALALSRPFTYGSIMRQLGRTGLYLKNVSVVHKLTEIDCIVFDKTGTMTTGSFSNVEFKGELNEHEREAVAQVVSNSTHPLSRAISASLVSYIDDYAEVTEYREVSGKGSMASVNNMKVALGAARFVGFPTMKNVETEVHLAIDDRYKGKFIFKSEFRTGIWDLFKSLNDMYSIHILSGDSEKDKTTITESFPEAEALIFNQSPQDKLLYIENLIKKGHKVMMVGDGLNDAGALDKAHVGIAVSEDLFNFTPNSDAILSGDQFVRLNRMLETSQFSKTVLGICFTFSILYNLVGLSFAVTGNLTPLVAAILMPLSSITVVFISTVLSRLKH